MLLHGKAPTSQLRLGSQIPITHLAPDLSNIRSFPSKTFFLYLYIYKNVCLPPVLPPRIQIRKSSHQSATPVHSIAKLCVSLKGSRRLFPATTFPGIGANVELYLPSMSEDPNIWSNPDKFNADQFNRRSKSEDDAVRIYRRICPRLRMAIIHVELMMARMVQEFEWSTDPTERQVDFTRKLVFTVVMKNSLRA
ncbi:hypothetical protein HID58_017673 [Brassica napus]|uniref:Uncharacterized protein n=1 Tax=Brassica napus TaxID=3708 RepID=A0ABQ8D8W7_BRANA|nr:hypothetical protein HID58_017673 [Brassica napus]